MKSIAIYFSHTGETIINNEIKPISEGNTAKVAKRIKEYTECDLFEIKPLKEYPFEYEECLRVAKKESREDERPLYEKAAINFDEYDVIYLGYPIWEGSFPRIMATFLFDNDFKGKIVKPFSTHGGSTSGYSDKELLGLVKNGKVKDVLALTAEQVVEDNLDELIGWVFDY